VDVFRIRDGAQDYVDCLGSSDRKDVFFADPSDVFDDVFRDLDNRCGDSRVLFTGRPRLFP
jgi:hypothetical protein